MEKSRLEISTNYSLSIYHISGSFTHIIPLSLHKNYARHLHPHFVGEIQIGQVTKGGRGAGQQSWGWTMFSLLLCPAFSGARCQKPRARSPMRACQLAFYFTVGELAPLGG